MVYLDFKMPPNDILSPFFISCQIVVISFSYVDFTKSFPLNCLLSKANGLPYCINITPIPFPRASHSTMNVLPKSSVVSTSVEHMASFKSENVKVSSSVYTNDFFLKKICVGACNACIILNKFSIISCKTQKSSKNLDVIRNRPFCNSLNLLRVHLNTFP
jgi:hypothetical protein